MVSKSTIQNILGLLDVNTPIIYLNDFDFARIDEIIVNVALQDNVDTLNIEEWNPTKGACKFTNKQVKGNVDQIISLETYLQNIYNIESYGVGETLPKKYYVLKEIQFAFDQTIGFNWRVISTLELIAQRRLYDNSFNSTIFIVNSSGTLPDEISKYASFVDVPYPTDEEITDIINEHLKINYNSSELNSEDKKKLLLSLKGMCVFDVDRAVDMALNCNNGTLTAENSSLILERKKQMIKKSGLLEFITTTETLDNSIGGLTKLKNYLKDKAKIFKGYVSAKEYGVKMPKGIFIVGMPGCGKSLCAKAASTTFNVPLLKMDMGSMMGRYVGQSEENLRKSLKIAEAVAPCVLWIDEIEKAFSGVKGSGSGNNDILLRMFGYFLSWLQEKDSSVYVIATANNADNLPPELKRKGRFDEIFCVNLPKRKELEAIFEVHLKKLPSIHKESVDKILEEKTKLAELAQGFNGADVESAINETVEKCFIDNKEINSETLEDTIRNTISITKSCKKQIQEMEKIFSESSFIDATTGEMTGNK